MACVAMIIIGFYSLTEARLTEERAPLARRHRNRLTATSDRDIGMRIAVIGSGTASRELPPHLATLGGAAVQPRIVNPRLSAFAFTPYDELLVDVGYVDAAQSAAAEGCDAIFINSFADYGIEAANAVLDVPVIGAGAATLAAAGAGGANFAIVTIWPRSMGFIYQERLRALDLADRCVGVWHVSPEAETRQARHRRQRDDAHGARRQRHHRPPCRSLCGSACRRRDRRGPGLAPAWRRSPRPCRKSAPSLCMNPRAADSWLQSRQRRTKPCTRDVGRRCAIPAASPGWSDCGSGGGEIPEPECPVCISN